eukprot:CAMPEP_0176380754 /NCGR_PEP_ID=MMETSP0126-20121128/31362_1 /TAXON_ID=141414 ORGANISM="Strombidinopsis acuminatum, Strain SPMC142" /NCGR_SAMPLE_ID=MMETSP0126 /ASSEMBLY_ACC=CAM_ASM_000229 /LENGTH=40 /DNA_ID= /DNA_START= /DNA_END= /DNA_ORIENTATION=
MGYIFFLDLKNKELKSSLKYPNEAAYTLVTRASFEVIITA